MKPDRVLFGLLLLVSLLLVSGCDWLFPNFSMTPSKSILIYIGSNRNDSRMSGYQWYSGPDHVKPVVDVLATMGYSATVHDLEKKKDPNARKAREEANAARAEYDAFAECVTNCIHVFFFKELFGERFRGNIDGAFTLPGLVKKGGIFIARNIVDACKRFVGPKLVDSMSLTDFFALILAHEVGHTLGWGDHQGTATNLQKDCEKDSKLKSNLNLDQCIKAYNKAQELMKNRRTGAGCVKKVSDDKGREKLEPEECTPDPGEKMPSNSLRAKFLTRGANQPVQRMRHTASRR